MTNEVKNKANQAWSDAAARYLSDAPDFVAAYYNSFDESKSEITKTSYTRDVLSFLRFIKNQIPELKDAELPDFPFYTLCNLTLHDIEDYKESLKKRNLSASTVKLKMAALASFYKYISARSDVEIKPENLLDGYSYSIKKTERDLAGALTAEQVDTLCDGIFRNNLYLGSSGNMTADERVLLKRERLVLRNIAVIRVLYDTGISATVLTALDVDDVNLNSGFISVSGNKIPFGDKTGTALSDYISGLPYSPTLSGFSGISEYDDFAKAHITDSSEVLDKAIKKKFPDIDGLVREDLFTLVRNYRRHGRDGFSYVNNALFVTTRGTRISVRMIEMMIKEMVETYLNIQGFSPDKFRR